jgi:phage gp36-like protein
MNRKALVIGDAGNEVHDETVRTYFLASAPGGWTCDIVMRGAGAPNGHIVAYLATMDLCVDYAIDNGYDIVIRSYTSCYSYKAEWDIATEAGIIVLVAHAQNLHARYTSPPRLFSAITVGGGNVANELSYGPGLEIFDLPADLVLAESWCTPTAAGRVAKFFDDHPAYNLFDAREHLREAASFYDNWVEDGGYGRATSGAEAALDLAPPLEVYALIDDGRRGVTFYWENFISTRFYQTRITKDDGTIIYQGTDVTFHWVSDVEGSEIFHFYSEDGDGELSPDEPFSTVTIDGLELPVLPEPAPVPEEEEPSYEGYCTQNGSTDGDICPARVSLYQLQRLTSEAGDAIIQSVIDKAIEAADDEINSYCGKKYVVPFDPVPTRVKNLSADIAVYKLYLKRTQALGGEVLKSIRDSYTDAIAFLKDVAAGRAVIDGAVKPTVNTTRTGGSFHANDRVFGKDSLDQL